MLHDQQTKDMLKRVAQLTHYSLGQLRKQADFPECLAYEEIEISEGEQVPFWERNDVLNGNIEQINISAA